MKIPLSSLSFPLRFLYSTECPKGYPLALCTYKPCAQKVCSGYPKAVCMNNPCGYCQNKWYLDGKEFECSKFEYIIVFLCSL